jgi:hypothetical protein
MVGGGIADAVAARLDRVHLYRCQVGEDLRRLLEFGPVELDILAGREVPVAAVVGARDVREHTQLFRRQFAVGNRHAQHRRIALDVKPVHEPERPELVFAELAAEEAPRLLAEFADSLIDQALVVLVIAVHGNAPPVPLASRPEGFCLLSCWSS